MTMTAQDIAALVGGQLQGDPSVALDFVASLKNAGPRDLTYADDKFHAEAAASKAGCIIVASGTFPGQTTIATRNPKLAFARAAQALLAITDTPHAIHPTAVIAPGVSIGQNVKVGPGAVIEAGVTIGNHSVIEAGSYIGTHSTIGEHCMFYPRVVLYSNVTVGHRVIIHSGAVIGADGFGFVRDGAAYVKFPQAGRVIIEDDVEIGANTCIDRGSLETTTIRRGVKLDNLVQIAHNVEVGENSVIASQTGISGSSTVGPQSIIGGQVGIGEHASLDRGTIIGGQGGVLNGKRVKGGEVLWGTPVKPLKEFLSLQAHLSRLPRLAEEVRRLRAEWDEFRKRS